VVVRDPVALSEEDELGLGVNVCDTDGLCDAVCVSLLDDVSVADAVGTDEEVAVTEGVAVGVSPPVTVWVGVANCEEDCVTELVEAPLDVGDVDNDGACEGDAVTPAL
jgi:hypothetical protein